MKLSIHTLLKQTALVSAATLIALTSVANANASHHRTHRYSYRTSRRYRKSTRHNRRAKWRRGRLYYSASRAKPKRSHRRKRKAQKHSSLFNFIVSLEKSDNRAAAKAKARKRKAKPVRRHRKARTSHDDDLYDEVFKLKNYEPNNIYGYNLNRYTGKVSPRLARHKFGKYIPNNDVIQQMDNEQDVRTLNDINADRAQYGLPALTENSVLDQIAAMRSEQIQKNFAHKNAQGQRMSALDGESIGLDPADSKDIGENIADGSLGSNTESNDPNMYFNSNASQISDMEDNSMMNYDQGSDNGHRENILSPIAKTVGIANSYDPSNNMFYLAEEFSWAQTLPSQQAENYYNSNLTRINN